MLMCHICDLRLFELNFEYFCCRSSIEAYSLLTAAAELMSQISSGEAGLDKVLTSDVISKLASAIDT